MSKTTGVPVQAKRTAMEMSIVIPRVIPETTKTRNNTITMKKSITITIKKKTKAMKNMKGLTLRT